MARLITTVGGAYSNSYVTVAQADAIAVNFPWYSEWDAFDDEEKSQALIQAAFAMQQLPWDGSKCSPASDANRPQTNWDQYWIKFDENLNGGIFDYFFDSGLALGAGQGDEVFKYGIDGGIIHSQVSSYRAKTFETALKFWDSAGTEIPPDDSESLSSSGSSGDQTRDIVYYWDSPVNISYITGRFNDAFNPLRSGTWYWGVYVNGEQLLNFPGTTATQSQRLAWPRYGVTCDGEEADCTYIPETILVTQVIIAYNFLKNPDDVPGTPGTGDSAPTGTYVKRQKLGDLEIEYSQFTNNAFNDECNTCDDPYLIQTYPWLRDMLGCWLEIQASGKGRIIGRVRS